MKKILKGIYILDTVILYFILFIFFLWSLFYIIQRFPPNIEATLIFLFVIFSFNAFFRLILKKAKSYHLLESIILPTSILMSSLYYIIPILGKMLPILEKQQQLEKRSAMNLSQIASKLQTLISEADFFSLDHALMLFNTETLPLVISIMIILGIHFIGNFKIYFSSFQGSKSKSKKKGLL